MEGVRIMNFDKQVILITGAAGDLGQALINALMDEGAHLALFDHREDRLKKMYPDLAGSGQNLIVDSIDLTDEQSVQSGIDQVIDHFGRIDVLINTVGGYTGGDPVDETSLEVWERMMAINVTSVFLTCRAVLPVMRSQGDGAVVNVGSRPGVVGRKNSGAYSASKSAVLRLTESIAAEVKADGVRVNAVIPGTIDTPDNRKAMPNANHDRWVEPSAVADVILFLASDAAREICGASIPVYGAS
jgi:NAD(P)-dependent dehydrogenase (short-subunit alcohol dehydrogenase family)